MKFHPVAELFALTKGEEFARLRSSIQTNGQREAIWLFDNLIIDGRNRYRACKELGIKPTYRTWDGLGPDADPAEIKAALTEFVLDLNLDRRHLDATRKGILAFDLLPVYEAQARERQAHGETGPGRTLTPKLEEALKGEAAGQAAGRTGVGRQYVYEIKRIAADHPEHMKDMREGVATLQDIKKRIKEGKREGIRAANRALVQAAPSMAVLGKDRFKAIVVDPPWDPADIGEVDVLGRGDPNYSTMTVAELEELPVGELSENNAHCYLWCTNRSIFQARTLMSAWGFEYKTLLVWCKPSIGLGRYLRNNTELCAFGVRGTLSVLRNDVGTWFEAPRPGKHSAKPDEFYGLVETLSPGAWLELFSREPRQGWASWGAEV